MKFRRQKTTTEDINITPLIDVVFLLLIFFMVSSNFTQQAHLAIDLPQADTAVVETPPETINIQIARDGHYSVNGVDLVNSQPATLAAALRQAAAGRLELPLVIAADGQANHRAVVAAMDVAGQSGFRRLSIATQPATQQPPARPRVTPPASPPAAAVRPSAQEF